MRTFSIKNFERFQHYADRKPPWIKLYRDIWGDRQFFRLKPEAKLLLIGLFTIASYSDNQIPDDPEWIAEELRLPEKLIDFAPLLAAGFLTLAQDDSASADVAEHSASGPLATCYPSRDARPRSASVSPSVSVSDSEGKSARRGVAVTWPDGLALDDELRAYATDRGIEPEAEFAAFRDWAASKAARYVDWRAAWRTRINNAPRFGVGRPPARAAPSGPNFGNGGMANLAKHLGLNDDARRNGEATRADQGQLVQAADRRPDDPHVAGNLGGRIGSG